MNYLDIITNEQIIFILGVVLYIIIAVIVYNVYYRLTKHTREEYVIPAQYDLEVILISVIWGGILIISPVLLLIWVVNKIINSIWGQ